MLDLAKLVSKSGTETIVGFDPAFFQTLAENASIDACIVSTEDGFSPLGCSRDFFAHDLGISENEIRELANWNQSQNERVTLVALRSRRQESVLKGIVLAPGQGSQCYPRPSVWHPSIWLDPPNRSFYYNVTYEAIAFACKAWGAKKLAVSHLSASCCFHKDIATSQADALGHFCDAHPSDAPASFTFCGCCIELKHLAGIQRLGFDRGMTVHRPIRLDTEETDSATLIHLDWSHDVGVDNASDKARRRSFQSTLPPLPTIRGWHPCWLTTSNPRDSIQMRMQLGYQPIRPEEVPGMEYAILRTGEWAGFIGIDDMLAFKLPTNLYEKYMQEAQEAQNDKP